MGYDLDIEQCLLWLLIHNSTAASLIPPSPTPPSRPGTHTHTHLKYILHAFQIYSQTLHLPLSNANIPKCFTTWFHFAKQFKLISILRAHTFLKPNFRAKNLCFTFEKLWIFRGKVPNFSNVTYIFGVFSWTAFFAIYELLTKSYHTEFSHSFAKNLSKTFLQNSSYEAKWVNTCPTTTTSIHIKYLVLALQWIFPHTPIRQPRCYSR